MIVNWYSPQLGTGDGYGSSAQRMIHGLLDAGHDVRIEPGYSPAGEMTIPAAVLQRPAGPQCDVRVIYAPPHWRLDWTQRTAVPTLGFTQWEDSVTPPSWIASLGAVDAVAAPSRFCVDLFQPYCTEPVQYVPLGVDHAFYGYRRRSKDNGTFTILHSAAGLGDPRKGAREAYLAFAKAFAGRNDVRLILRGQGGDVDTGNDPRVEKRRGYLTEIQKRDLLYDAHVYLYPSMGEGFGLMPLEAIATGLPTIASRNTSMLDYAPLFYGVDCDPVPSGNRTPTIPSSSGQWMKPRHHELVTTLRDVFERYDTVNDVAWAAANVVRDRWGWNLTHLALERAIRVARTRSRLRAAVSA